jgi:hypothetical protein
MSPFRFLAVLALFGWASVASIAWFHERYCNGTRVLYASRIYIYIYEYINAITPHPDYTFDQSHQTDQSRGNLMHLSLPCHRA